METTEKEAISIDGKIIGFKANKHGDIDALEIEQDGKLFKINFPPHTAKLITETVHEGDHAAITYEEEKPKSDPKGVKKPKLKLQSLTGTSGSELSISDIKPEKPSGEPVAEIFNLDSFELLKGKKDELLGIKSGKKLIHIHKEDQELTEKVKPDSKLEIVAIKRTDQGFINEHQDDVYHIQKVIIDGQEYTTKK